ncbi:MAG TPA: hypothetical protein VFE65_01485, partial [Pseudonocardia sp.]|nr:hypothetical protein [Pseudonocardia sp.]
MPRRPTSPPRPPSPDSATGPPSTPGPTTPSGPTGLSSPPNPFAHLTEEELEQLGKEFAAIHEEVYADLGDRDRRYITGIIRMHRQL